MDSTKKRERRKIFKCFRPPVDGDDGLINQNDGGNEFSKPPVVRYVAVGEKGKILISDEKFVDGDVNGGVDCLGKRSSSRRRISRVFKAVLFDAALTKKICNSKSGKYLFRSNRCFSFNSEKMVNTFNDDKILYGESSDAEDSSSSNPFSSSRTVSSSLSTSCSSSLNSNSRSLSERKASSRVNSMERKLIPPASSSELQKPRRRKKSNGFYSSNIALCLLFVSVLVLIFWGRICSILFASIWLVFGQQRVNHINSPAIVVDSPDTESEEYKKRVIMEGLLERNRNKLQSS